MGNAPGTSLRVLVVDARVPTPLRDGGSLRLVSLLRIMKRLGFDVAFVPLFPASFPPFDDSLGRDSEELEALGVELPSGPGKPSLEEHLSTAGATYAVAWLSGIYVAAHVAPMVRRYAPAATLLFDTIDLHHIREYREARLTGSVPRVIHAIRVKRAELALARQAAWTIVVSETERRTLEREVPGVATWVIPNVHTVDPEPPEYKPRRGLAYLGAFSNPTNIDAVLHFVKEILPGVRRELPDAPLTIAGADPPPEIQTLASKWVIIPGFLENLSLLFRRTRVFVAPLRYGAGIKGKLLLSMGYGVPAVASPVAAEGIGAEDGRHVLIARSDADWPCLVARLYRDESLWRQLSTEGIRLVENGYSMGVVEMRLRALFEAVARRQNGTGREGHERRTG